MSQLEAETPPSYVPTSEHLSRLLDQAENEAVTVGWLIEQLGTRSFGLTLFIMAVIALVPGASTVIGVLIAWPAIQMMLGHHTPVLPGFFARRKISVARLARAIRFLVPRLRWLERLFRPRWPMQLWATERMTGVLVLLLGVTLISPFPFSHVIPAGVIMLLALAYLEEDGAALLVSLLAALSSLAITAAALWGAVETADFVDRLWPF
jgi:hypothetical protein